jgi:hypothetical protein
MEPPKDPIENVVDLVDLIGALLLRARDERTS